VIVKPEVDRHHIVDKDEVAQLFARVVAAVRAKQLHFALFQPLMVLVKGNAGHATFVLLARAIDIEVAKPRHLCPPPREVVADLSANPLIEQQLGVAVHIQRALEFGLLAKGL
jgi:hypothetical protein